MALKFRIEKADFDKLSADLKGEYKEVDGKYVLNVEGNEDADALRRAKDHEAAERKREKDRADAAEQRARDAETQRTKDAEDAARKSGDTAALEASWKAKVDEANAKLATADERHKATIDGMLRGTQAKVIAAEISTVPELMETAILSRLTVEHVKDGEPILRVLDKAGKPSAMSVEDLKKEYVEDPRYASIITGSNASGGGAGQGRGTGSGATKTKLSEYSEAERVELAKTNLPRFNELVAAARVEAGKGAQT